MAKNRPVSPTASLHLLEAHELAELIRRRRLSPTEAIRETLDRIARLNPAINAFLSVFEEQAMASARRAERALMREKIVGPLHGVSVSIKDIVLTTEAPTTAGSKIFGAGLIADDDAPVVRRLRRAGAIIIGKTNLHEVALGVTSDNEHFGAVRNPWDTSRVAGGSSGGSAAAVAAGLGPLSVGTDTRGSIRIPAACCGVTGLKPTRGLISTDDVVPLSPTLDHVGPIARSAEDCALLLAAMAGSRLRRHARRGLRGLRIGISEYHLRDLDSGQQRPIEQAIKELRRLGCRLQQITIPLLEGVQEASVAISSSEAVAYHDPMLKAQPDAYGPRVRERLEGGYRRTAVEYLQALEVRQRVIRAFDEAFTRVDCLVGATLPAFAPRVGEYVVRIDGREAPLVDSFTRLNSPQNMAGVPALSMPCGEAEALPVGLQLIAPSGQDALLLGVAMAFQRATDWHHRHPPLA